MGRFSGGGSYDHRVRRFAEDWYQIYWTVDFYYPDSRLRFPRIFTRNTDERGARRFCKKWGIPWEETDGRANKV